MSRSYNDELQFLDKLDKNCWRIKKGFVPNMHVSGGALGRGGGARFRARRRRRAASERVQRAHPPDSEELEGSGAEVGEGAESGL